MWLILSTTSSAIIGYLYSFIFSIKLLSRSVLSDDPSLVFTVEIARTKNISAIRKAIKDERKPAFDHVPADTLNLWKVSEIQLTLVKSSCHRWQMTFSRSTLISANNTLAILLVASSSDKVSKVIMNWRMHGSRSQKSFHFYPANIFMPLWSVRVLVNLSRSHSYSTLIESPIFISVGISSNPTSYCLISFLSTSTTPLANFTSISPHHFTSLATTTVELWAVHVTIL